AFGAGQTHAALIREQFADGTNATAAQVIDIVRGTFTLLKAEEIFGRGDQIFLCEDAAFRVLFLTELLDNLVTSDAAEIITLRIEEQALDQRAGVRGGWRIARTESPVNILERLFFVLGWILLEALDDNSFVAGRIHDANLVRAEFGDLLNDGFG